MSDYEPHAFCCHSCGWMVGESYREAGSRVTQLRVFRHARSVGEEIKVLDTVPTWVKYATTKANDCVVPCEHCGAETGWFANQTAIEEMLGRTSKRRLAEGEYS